MMGFISNILSDSSSNLLSNMANVADQFITTGDEKQAFKLQMESLVQQRESQIEQTLRAELGAKREVVASELRQDDKYTKRARPTLVYFGLLMIAINHMIFPILARFFDIDSNPLPPLPLEFWVGWSGIVGTWSIGRSAEKIGATNKITRLITGRTDSAGAKG